MDLRSWLSKVEQIGELKRIQGASEDLEIGFLTAENSARYGPALLFEAIPGYDYGFRILTSCVMSRPRIEITCNLPPTSSPSELTEILEEKPLEWEQKAALYPPRQVSRGPVEENIVTGDQIDLLRFPIPKWHEADGGRYIGTGCLVIIRDPDTGSINIGTYRTMLVNKNTVTVYISPGKHGYLIMKKYHQRGQACPMAISIGHHPLLLIVAGLPIGSEIGEYNYAGAIMGEPVEVIRGQFTGLPVPAASEMVLEGECRPNEEAMEGPFGEWTGYYAGGRAPASLLRVQSIQYRNEPIMVGCSPAKRGDQYEIMYYRAFLRSAMIKKALQAAGVPGVKAVWTPELGGTRLLVIISLRQEYAGQVKQAAYIASQCRDGAYLGRYVIVVDEDIDPTDMNEVLWAVCTRTDPERDIEIIKRTWSSRIDPIPSADSMPEINAYFNSRAIIDACIPFERRHQFSQRIGYSPEVERELKKRWQETMGW